MLKSDRNSVVDTVEKFDASYASDARSPLLRRGYAHTRVRGIRNSVRPVDLVKGNKRKNERHSSIHGQDPIHTI